MGIAVRDVSKSFGGVTVLEDVSLDVPSGALTALLGPSGSGKSTLLRVIAGLEEPDTGSVEIEGSDATSLPPQRREVGFCFQHYAAFKHMTVRENVAFGMRIRRRSKEEIDARVDELLALVHLDGFGDRYPNQMSGGQRQRMALARALAVEPKVLLLDEPFGALDATVRKELRRWLRRLHDEVHVTTIFVTHDQEEAMDVAEQIVVMREGRIEQVGPPRELYERPANEFVMSFVGAVNRLGDDYVRPHDVEIELSPNGASEEVYIDRVVYLGFEVRVEFTNPNGDHQWVQLPRDRAEELGLDHGQKVYVRGKRPVELAEEPHGDAVTTADELHAPGEDLAVPPPPSEGRRERSADEAEDDDDELPGPADPDERVPPAPDTERRGGALSA